MVNPLYNNREKRLRAFWRLLFQFALNSVGLVLVGGLGLVLLTVSEETGLGGGPAETVAAYPATLAIGSIATLLVTVASVWLAGRLFDHRPFSEFGLQLDRSWWLDLCFGLALGVLLMTGIFLVEL